MLGDITWIMDLGVKRMAVKTGGNDCRNEGGSHFIGDGAE
jgi:hypothetical protein